MKMVKGFESLLAGSLDLEEPWYITGAEFNPVKNVIDVYVGIREDAVIACPHCGGPTKRYGYEPTERSWRHADCLFYPCYVHCKRPRVKCDNCGVQQVTAPFERHGGKASNITAVTSDMSKSYLPGVRENFPDAEQIIDKFHVKKALTDALDKVRKQEQKETNNKKDLFLNRHFLMTPQSRMNSEQLTKFAALSKAYPKTGRAFRIVQALDLFYASKDDKEAWCTSLSCCC